MRFLVVLALLPGCYLQGRGQVSNTYGGGGGGVGFMVGDDRQDGELGMEVASSRTPAAPNEPNAPMMMMLGGRYAHAVDPGGWLRVYGRASIGDETCPFTAEAKAADGCVAPPMGEEPIDVRHTSIAEVGAGVAFTFAKRAGDNSGATDWDLGSISVGVVYSAQNTRERGSSDFVGVDIALTVGFDPLRALSAGGANH